MAALQREARDNEAASELRRALSRVVKRLEGRQFAIATEMRELLVSSIDDLSSDSRTLELLQASVESNVSTILHMLSNDIGLEALKPPTAAIEYAVRLAQHDVPLSGLTRAYYLGQSMMLRVMLEEIGQLDLPEGPKFQAVRAAADSIHGYIDWMLQRVTDAYGAEHRRWWSARATANTAIILKVLRGETVSQLSFATETRYSLEHRHLAMVAWIENSSGGVEDQQRLDRLVRQVASLLRSPQAPLASAVDRLTIWSWVAMPTERIDRSTRQAINRLVAESGGIRLALGAIGSGVTGFRRSHEQAVGARQVALATRSHGAEPVIADSDPNVALSSILLKDRAATLAWAHQVLGDFASPGASNEAMRETLKVFYGSGQNYSHTAEALGVHRNTVRHRVSRFEEDRIGEILLDPLEVALALRVHETFGE